MGGRGRPAPTSIIFYYILYKNEWRVIILGPKYLIRLYKAKGASYIIQFCAVVTQFKI
jgi:hypothetical protein